MGNIASKQPCPRPCSDCDEGHHWLPGDEVNDPEHEAAIAGESVWYECKHCDAWIDCDEMDRLEGDAWDAEDYDDTGCVDADLLKDGE